MDSFGEAKDSLGKRQLAAARTFPIFRQTGSAGNDFTLEN
jgi:hypothetical protein